MLEWIETSPAMLILFSGFDNGVHRNSEGVKIDRITVPSSDYFGVLRETVESMIGGRQRRAA